MNKHIRGWLSISVLLIFFGLGYLAANLYNHWTTPNVTQKPVVDIKEKRDVIDENTQVIYEQDYLKCGHTIISEFSDRQILEGKTLDQVKKIFTTENGYTLEFNYNTLIVHQDINDWCEADKNKCRLKEFQGRVAVYKGPDSKNDRLEKVTNIYMSSLPVEIQEKIRRGEWEFNDIDSVNDALENLDEYL
ncbi:MAG: hypothetical protein GX790_02475 [Syntrophomonadaceae bacterium]|nr:hypothetical protein [Syntrophomonadaceae bacterium]